MTKASVKLCRHIPVILALAAIIIGSGLWVANLLESPLLYGNRGREKQYLQEYIQANSPDYARERELAELYWHRYPDVKRHHYFGTNGPMGIWGAREHYNVHGKREGRLWGP